MEQTNKPSDQEVDARIMALVSQRNSAMDQAAVLLGKVALMEQRIRELETKLAELEPKEKEKKSSK